MRQTPPKAPCRAGGSRRRDIFLTESFVMQSTRRCNVNVIVASAPRAVFTDIPARAAEREAPGRRCTLPASLIKDGWWLEDDTTSRIQRRTTSKEN
jgi:hypothetical protein